MNDKESDCYVPIVTLFDDTEEGTATNRYYQEAVLSGLKKMLPPPVFAVFKDPDMPLSQKRKQFEKLLPCTLKTHLSSFPGNISFFALSRYRANSFKFFFEMISRWLTPGKRLDVVLIHASDFLLKENSHEVYTICEVMIRVKSPEEYQEIERNFPVIQSEINLGIESAFFSEKIFDVKGLSADEKTALIQEFIANRSKRFPGFYSYDVFTEMQHTLLICPNSFKEQRTARHLGKIICIHYHFRHLILEATKAHPEQRHIRLKIFRPEISLPNKRKKVLGILVGLNFLAEGEVFNEKQMLKSIQSYIPNSQSVKGAFFTNTRGSENIATIYMEIEKKNEELFTTEELKLLQDELPLHIKKRIELRHHSIFNPRNEEEIIRNILILSDQLKYARDIPQMLISFDQQTHTELAFTIVIVRLLKNNTLSIPHLFESAQTDMEFILNKTKTLGLLRKKYPKEATVFQLKISKHKFLREDQSIDLYKARQYIVSEINKVMGDVRDYNGGMISKQIETLSHIRQLLEKKGAYNEQLMEDFFYGFTPDAFRPLVHPHTFVELFNLLTHAVEEITPLPFFRFQIQENSSAIYALITCKNPLLAEKLENEMTLSSLDSAKTTIIIKGILYFGYICQTPDKNRKELFNHQLRKALNSLPTEDQDEVRLNISS